MKKFWSAVLNGAVWVAHYAAEHPEQVTAAVKAFQVVQAAEGGK